LLIQKDVQLGQLQGTVGQLQGSIAVKDNDLLTKNQLLTQTASKVKKVSRKLAQEAQSKNQLFIQKELEKEELRIQKEGEVRSKSAEKNRIIEDLTSNLFTKEQVLKGLNDTFLTKEEEIVGQNLKIGDLSHKLKKTNRKVAAKDKLISDKDQEIETLKVLLAQKEAEKAELIVQKEELLVQKDEEIDDKSFIKNLTINSLLEELIVKYTENNNLKMVNLLKQIEIEENEEVISQKNNELLIKDLLIEFQQDEVELREEAIADLKLLNQQLSHVDLGIQINGNEVSTQVNEIDLAGHHLESQSDFELI